MASPWDRVYINLGPDFKPKHSLDLDELLELYARARERSDNTLRLFDDNGNLCLRRTKSCLVSAANRFISDLNIVTTDENMASYTSGRQIKFLKYALLKKRKKAKISGYALILLHCIYAEIKASATSEEYTEILKEIAEDIHQLISTYYDLYPNDEIARFLLACYAPLSEEMKQNTCYSKTAFPDIPKSGIHEQPDE